MRNARALVLPSFAEGLPVVIMKAMALQRPVLSTYVVGIPELVKPGENGWLIPAGGAEMLKDAILNVLLTRISELDRLGENAGEKVLEQHDIETEAGKLLGLFESSTARWYR